MPESLQLAHIDRCSWCGKHHSQDIVFHFAVEECLCQHMCLKIRGPQNVWFPSSLFSGNRSFGTRKLLTQMDLVGFQVDRTLEENGAARYTPGASKHSFHGSILFKTTHHTPKANRPVRIHFGNGSKDGATSFGARNTSHALSANKMLPRSPRKAKRRWFDTAQPPRQTWDA